MTTPNPTDDYEKQARALLLRSNVSSGCTAMLGLFGASVIVLFVIGLTVLSLLLFEAGGIHSAESIGIVIIALLCFFFIVMGVVIAGLSYSSFKANRLKAKESKRYIETYRERKAAQHGSISMASTSGEGALNMVSEQDEDHDSSYVTLDLDTAQDEHATHHRAEHSTRKK